MNYLLFHGLVELTSVAVAGSVFAITWNTRVHRPEGEIFFLVIGIASLCSGTIDLIHTLAYKGMNIFPGYDADLPTQLWIASRFLQSLSFLASTISLFRVLPLGPQAKAHLPVTLLLLYMITTGALLFIIFAGYFPACFIEGSGLTTFKRNSEYVICAVFVIAAFLLWLGRDRVEKDILIPLLAAFILSILVDLAFTLYRDVYGIFNMIGHILKLLVFIALYRAIVLVGIQKPFTLISRKLIESGKRFSSIVENLNDALLITDFTGSIQDLNENACGIFGYPREELLGANIALIVNQKARGKIADNMAFLGTHDDLLFEMDYIRKDSSVLPVEVSAKVVSREGDGLIQSFIRDISARKQAETSLRKTSQENRILLGELQHRAKNSFSLISSMIGLSSGAVDDPVAREAFSELDARVRSVSELYALLYSAGSPGMTTGIRLDEYCGQVASTMAGLSDRIELKVHLEEMTTAINTAAPIGIILTELMTNSFKYAFPDGLHGTLTISLEKTLAGARLMVADDGIGLPVGFNLSVNSGMGLNLVKGLAEQIEGHFSMGVNPESGGRGVRSVVEFRVGNAGRA